jgi:biotin carboxylase
MRGTKPYDPAERAMTRKGNFSNKRVLILASKMGYQTREFAEAAKKLGVGVVWGTDRCHKLEDPWADGAMALHFESPEEAAGEIRRALSEREGASGRVDAILALGDAPTVTGALAARALGLAGNAPEAVSACRNKLAQRSGLKEAGVRVPRFWRVAVGEDARAAAEQVEFPCVVKPVALAASQGVIRADDAEEFVSAVDRVRALLARPEMRVAHRDAVEDLIAEKYVAGAEVAVEGLISEGTLRILAIFDKPDPLEGPYFEESIYVTPSRLRRAEQEEIRACAGASVRALGLRTGPVHAEFRVNEEGAWVLEVAPRPIGGLCARALRFGPAAGEISLEELLIRHALGDASVASLEREEAASAVMMIPVPRSGVFEGVSGVEEARTVRFVTGVEITARVKDYIAAWPEGSSYLGFIFARARTAEEAEDAVREAHGKLGFDLRERLPVGHPVTGRMA